MIEAVGTGNRVFYPSGPVLDGGGDPFLLLDGEIYAFSAVWGSTTVTYWYDNVPSNYYPQDFSKGTLLGGAAANVTPPIDPEFQDPLGIFTWSGGAYSLQLCFKPDPGACCLPGDICVDEGDATECLNQGGIFAGPLTTCLEVNCPLDVAACCLPNGTCEMLTEFVCETTEGGVWHEDMDCGDDPCSPRGGCCVDTPEICIDNLTENQCTLQYDGFYRGDDVDCEDFPGCRAGACCFDDQCVVPLSEQDCLDFGGVYQGDATLCEPGLCEPVGACCIDSTCVDGLNAGECAAQSGIYRGDGTECDTLSPACGRGACCSDFGCVPNLTQTNCVSQLGGTFQGEGTTCELLEEHCPGVCCWGSGSGICSEDFTPEFCTDLPNGTFLGYMIECADDPCPGDAGGACCLAGGNCAFTTETACNDLGGGWNAGLSCGEANCSECDDNQDCNDGDLCTLDICDGGICVHEPDTTFCPDDNNPCTIDVCMLSQCNYFDVVCDDNDLCTDDVCNTDNGQCVFTPVNCDDGMYCNGIETCDPETGDCLDNLDPCYPRQGCDEDADFCYGAGDMDADGDVDLYDFDLWQGCFDVLPVAPACEAGDIDADGDVDLDDFAVMYGDVTGPAQ